MTGSAQRAARMSQRERLVLDLGRWLDKHLTPVGIAVYRLTKGSITRPFRVDALLLTTRGRRSGRSRTVVLQFFRDGEAMLLAAANDGGASHPGWYYNLMASPMARVEVMGTGFSVHAEALPPDEATDAWTRILVKAPSYERYLRATSRVMPVVRLVRADPVGEQATTARRG